MHRGSNQQQLTVRLRPASTRKRVPAQLIVYQTFVVYSVPFGRSCDRGASAPEKLQKPNTKHPPALRSLGATSQRNTNIQAPNSLLAEVGSVKLDCKSFRSGPIGAWSLELLWCLACRAEASQRRPELGFWCFRRRRGRRHFPQRRLEYFASCISRQ